MAGSTLIPPETTASSDGTIYVGQVVVAVKGREAHAIVFHHCISCVARVPTDRQLVLGRLAVYDERAVLGPKPGSTRQLLKVKPRLVQTVLGQLMQQFVAEPVVVVAGFAAEPRLERFPRLTEERRTVDVLLEQQRRAVFCMSAKNFVRNPVTTYKQRYKQKQDELHVDCLLGHACINFRCHDQNVSI